MYSVPAGASGTPGQPPSLSLSDVTPARRSQKDTTARAHGDTMASSWCDCYTSATEIPEIEAGPADVGDAWYLVPPLKKCLKEHGCGSSSSSETGLSHPASAAPAKCLAFIFAPRTVAEKFLNLCSFRVPQTPSRGCVLNA